MITGEPTERARLRFNPQFETMFGVQIATNQIEEGIAGKF